MLYTFSTPRVKCLQWDSTKLVLGTYNGSIMILEMPTPEEINNLKKIKNYKVTRKLASHHLDIGCHTDAVYCLQVRNNSIESLTLSFVDPRL